MSGTRRFSEILSMIVGGGGAPLASIALGQGRRERAGRILGNGFVMLILFSAVTSTLAYIFMEPLLMLTGASENTIVYATDYLEIYLAGTVFVQISTGLNSFISAQGRPGIAMLSTVIGAATNLILDPVFIFALGMGVKGAALATIISQALSALWVLRFLFSSRASLRLDPGHMKIERKVFLLVPLAIILPEFFGVKGVYLAESVADATAAICCMTIFMIFFPKILAKGSGK